jgi:DNA polymerase III alpha subunit (gram-positive type)
MKYIVFDTEYTSWKGSQERNWSNINEHRELVQIAALKIDNGEIIDKLDLYIKPNINTILSEYFTKLTGISNEDITEKGNHIIDALHLFLKFTNNYPIYSYGNDYIIIEENLLLNCIPLSSKLFSSEWKNNFIDFRELLYNYNINTDEYTSGTIYKAFNLEIDNHMVHNAMHDTFSLYLVSKKIFDDT